jgi:hypothetical protein
MPLPEPTVVGVGTGSNADTRGSQNDVAVNSGHQTAGPRLDQNAVQGMSESSMPDATPVKQLASSQRADDFSGRETTVKSDKENGSEQSRQSKISDEAIALPEPTPFVDGKGITQLPTAISLGDGMTATAFTMPPTDNAPGMDQVSKASGPPPKDRPKAIDGAIPATGDSDTQNIGIVASQPLSPSAAPASIPGKNAGNGNTPSASATPAEVQPTQGGVSMPMPGANDVHLEANDRHAGQTANAGDGRDMASSGTSGVASAPTLMPTVNSAQLIQSMHHSEMKLGLNSAEFGQISINTSMTRQTMSAQISVDHAELGRMLAVHLPSIEQRLGNAYGLQTRVQIHENNSGTQGKTNGQDTSQKQGARSTGATQTLEGNAVLAPISAVSRTLDTARLDIRI